MKDVDYRDVFSLKKQLRELQILQSNNMIEYERRAKKDEATITLLEKTILTLKKDLEFLVNKDLETVKTTQNLQKSILELEQRHHEEKSVLVSQLQNERTKSLILEQQFRAKDSQILLENKQLKQELYSARNELKTAVFKVHLLLIRTRNF